MRSADLTASARIREAAMRLFADRGFAEVTVRDVAEAAGVSSSLVMHHYRSKEGLKAAVDERAAATLVEVFSELGYAEGLDGATGSLAARVASNLKAEPVLPSYIRRMLVDGGPAGEDLFRGLFEGTAQTLADLEQAGMVRPTDDDALRAVIVMVSDLAVILLRDQIACVLGVDPLSAGGVARWTKAAMELYSQGMFVSEADA